MRKLLTLLPVAALALAAGCDDVMTGPTANRPGGAPAFANDPPVTGAAFTTTNPTGTDANGDADGTGHCKNGNEAVNCNIYDGKKYVWLNGGPLVAYVGDGTYFFAVLSPGGQPAPNDGGTNQANGELANLSDNYDLYTNRTFTVASGQVSYSGSHDFSDNKIRLMPYEDTPNPGGVYILAICSLEQGYPVTPSRCKYDAFKIREGNPPIVGEPLTAIKTADATFDRAYNWTIAKGATEVSRSSSSYVFEYTVTVKPADPPFTDSNHAVKGTITVFNINSFDVDATISDAIAGATCTLDDPDGKVTVPAEGQISVGYTCALSTSANGTNVATIAWNTTTVGGVTLAAGSTTAEAGFAFAGPSNETNKTITITDSFNGGATITLGTVTYPSSGTVTTPTPAGISNLAWSSSKQAFTYRRTIKTVADECIDYDNTATIKETGQSADATVTVCGPISGGYTIGFWGNKNGDTAIKACGGSSVYASLSALNLVDAKGNDFNPANHAELSAWLRNADATNMSYMLSAQMAATWLDVNCGVNNKKMNGDLMVTNPADPSTTITITDALAAANDFLDGNKNTTASGPARSLAEAYKNLFDGLNNGWIFVQP